MSLTSVVGQGDIITVLFIYVDRIIISSMGIENTAIEIVDA